MDWVVDGGSSEAAGDALTILAAFEGLRATRPRIVGPSVTVPSDIDLAIPGAVIPTAFEPRFFFAASARRVVSFWEGRTVGQVVMTFQGSPSKRHAAFLRMHASHRIDDDPL